MLLIAKNNVIPTTLLYPVFNKLEKLVIFGRVLQALKQTLLALINSINHTEVVSPERKPPDFTRTVNAIVLARESFVSITLAGELIDDIEWTSSLESKLP